MRNFILNGFMKAKAYAGTYVIVLAWDFESVENVLDELMGFAIQRTEMAGNKILEKYPRKGIKRFKEKDKGLPPGTPVSTFEHPIQSFQWCDYTAKENREYIYEIIPLYGKPKNLNPKEHYSISIKIKTEAVNGNNNGIGKHDIYFNRGVIGSQAYAREFGNVKPNANDPYSPEMKWLSRGLFEALKEFISKAKDGFKLKAAFYEFHYLPIAVAFAKAIQAGADVKIVYDAESTYKENNEKTINAANLQEVAISRTVSEGIRHNKFIVLLDGDKPIAVWTGSVNISAGGIFGHSNVGHIIWDKSIAKSYFEYWERLSNNLTPSQIRPLNKQSSALPTGLPMINTITPIFSPRDDKNNNDTLNWYAHLMGSAKKIMCITVAFNLDEVFQNVIQKQNDVLIKIYC
ncbi:phospholipase D-like domain-containing protein [Chryseobacterium arthrosphaerae]|uniref:phospholipase D-like domain-containing protein n=1 Tax=Chryseobacterium arthrosphaerae TaxID=651561 RepID=UPI001E2C6C0F|nr:phospholipase D-like domain-containing protein [Chryseobacterium arthrosphaerae]